MWGRLNPRGLAYAVAAGPASNIALAAAALAARAAAGVGPVYDYLSGFAYINAYMALFNLIPIRPLDGEKIVRYSPAWWAALAALSAALLLAA